MNYRFAAARKNGPSLPIYKVAAMTVGMVLTVCSHAPAQAPKGTDLKARLLAEMDIWPSRFKNTRTEFQYENGKYRTTLSPDLCELDGLTPAGIEPELVWQDGESWQRCPPSANGDQWVRNRGSELAVQIHAIRAKIEDSVLLPLGVSIGSYSIADAAKKDPHLTVSQQGNRLVTSYFPLYQGGIPVYVSVTWDAEHHAPLLIKSKVKNKDFIRVDLTHFDSVNQRGYVDVANLVDKSGRYRLTSIVPLTRRAPRFALKDGERYIDQCLGIEAIVGADRVVEEKTAKPILTAARASKNLTVPGKTLSLACGPDALFYYLRLKGADVSNDSVRQHFPTLHYGTSMKQLATVAAQCGQDMHVVKGSRLTDLPTPAILSVRPSHFVVLVSISGQNATIIDPPFKVTVERTNTWTPSWTGYALVGGK